MKKVKLKRSSHTKSKCRFCSRRISSQGKKRHELSAHSDQLALESANAGKTVLNIAPLKQRKPRYVDHIKHIGLTSIEVDQDYVLVPVKKTDLAEIIKKLLM